MNRLRKFGKWTVFLVVLLVAAKVGVSFAMRTHRFHGYLVAHLERAFGRPVQVSQFSMQILPLPRLEMTGITVGEDPAFGNEYFLRAENMQAGLRWMGLLRGHFEFGTMSLTRPSLILVRNRLGQWNMEEWLPPAEAKSGGGSTASGQQTAASPSNYLEKIEFDDGRVNFKTEDEKRVFAFIDVSGSVEQVGPGRWQLNLEAKPWRSGVVLQSAGVLYVRGDVAGTSARLQPAQLQVHWDKVSLADLFRLITGNDSGVRGEFGLDGTASVGMPDDAANGQASPSPGKWKYQVEARATQIHRWDLTERGDNPRVSLHAKGEWDLRSSEAIAEELRVDLPHSNLRGAGWFGTNVQFPWSARIESAALEARDMLAWYRAFKPDVADGLAAEQFFTGEGTVRGWPIQWDAARLESSGGVLRVPGVVEPLRIGAVRGGLQRNQFVIEPVRVTSSATKLSKTTAAKEDKAATRPNESQNWAEFRFAHDETLKHGGVRVEGHLEEAELFFRTAAALGKIVNHGWELKGQVSGRTAWEWDRGLFRHGHWNGTLTFTKAELQAAGLNQPIVLDDAQLQWNAGQRTATINKAEALGATWSGAAGETRAGEEGDLPRWQFRLHADHLDAAELDRWAGPRARPNWLQRLLPSLLGNANAGGKPSELLRRVSAEGELSADTISIEKIRLERAHAKLSLQDLHLSVRDAEAEWAGGTVRGALQAVFAASPKYEVTAEVDRANLALLPWIPGWPERWNGIASGRIHLTTTGVGREELLKQVAGGGEIRLKNVDLRGWDVTESLESGIARAGISHWNSGAGMFEVKDRVARFDSIQLEGPRIRTSLAGALEFGQEATFTFSPGAAEKRGASRWRVLKLSGAPDTPRAVIESVSPAAPKL
jgi:AsmA family